MKTEKREDGWQEYNSSRPSSHSLKIACTFTVEQPMLDFRKESEHNEISTTHEPVSITNNVDTVNIFK